jgi:hypothetical protein
LSTAGAPRQVLAAPCMCMHAGCGTRPAPSRALCVVCARHVWTESHLIISRQFVPRHILIGLSCVTRCARTARQAALSLAWVLTAALGVLLLWRAGSGGAATALAPRPAERPTVLAGVGLLLAPCRHRFGRWCMLSLPAGPGLLAQRPMRVPPLL